MAEGKGAGILGLGAFTSVVGDAGITIAHESDIAITSGNSLTVAMTLEAAKQAVQLMGVKDLTQGKAMIVGMYLNAPDIDRRARRLAKAARRLANGGVDERHAIRIAAKKLRYATEFFATLFPARRARVYRKALAVLQDELGAFNDAAVAPRVAAALAGPTAAATVAIESWSAGRAGASGRGIAAAWSAFEAVAPFWKRA